MFSCLQKNRSKEKTGAVDSSLEETDTEVLSEQSDESNYEESVRRLEEKDGRALKDMVETSSEEALMEVILKDHKELSRPVHVKLLIVSDVHKTLLSEKDWDKVKQMRGKKTAKLTACHTRFLPFGTNLKLPIMGRSKCSLKAACDRRISTVIYVVKGESQSLLGLEDGKALGVISINPDGQNMQEQVNRVTKASMQETKAMDNKTQETWV